MNYEKIININGQIAPNKTTTYLLPTLDVEHLSKYLLNKYQFINAYISCEDLDYKQCLYLLFNPSKSRLEKWAEFYALYSKENGYITCFDLDKNVVVVVIKIKEKYKNFPRWMMKGKYSWLGKEYANFFIDRRKHPPTKYKPWYTINRDEEYKKKLCEFLDIDEEDVWELDDLPDVSEERLNWNKIKEQYGEKEGFIL